MPEMRREEGKPALPGSRWRILRVDRTDIGVRKSAPLDNARTNAPYRPEAGEGAQREAERREGEDEIAAQIKRALVRSGSEILHRLISGTWKAQIEGGA